MGLACDIIDLTTEDDNGHGGDRSGDRPVRSAAHFERSAALGTNTWNVFQLWAEAYERSHFAGGEPARRKALHGVYCKGVAAGVWSVPEQRPAQRIPSLTAQPWHNPQVCCRPTLSAPGQQPLASSSLTSRVPPHRVLSPHRAVPSCRRPPSVVRSVPRARGFLLNHPSRRAGAPQGGVRRQDTVCV